MKLHPILAGTSIPMPSSEKDGTRGGYVRREAPTDGFAWEEGEVCGFLALQVVEAALGDLKLAQRSKPSPVARFRGRRAR